MPVFSSSEPITCAFDALKIYFIDRFNHLHQDPLSLVISYCDGYCNSNGINYFDTDASTLPNLFQKLQRQGILNYLNVGLLKYFARSSRDESLDKSVQKFCETFQDTIVDEEVNPRHKFLVTGKWRKRYKKIFTKLIKKEKITYGELQDCVITLCGKVFQISYTENLISSCKRGCICLEILIPSCNFEFVFHAACSNIKVLAELKVKHIVIGKYWIKPFKAAISGM